MVDVGEFTFNTCRSIINEPGAIRRIGEICRRAGISRPLLVTDPGLRDLGLLARLEQQLDKAGIAYTTFHEVVLDPTEAAVEAAVHMALESGVDGVIGFGGGSSMDTAKLVALIAMSGESLAEIYGVEMAQGPRLPLILFPTTAGSGSEVTAVAIVTTGATTKAGVVSSLLYPDVAVLDAELTLGLPPRITATTGIDAMVHAIEAYTSAHQKNIYSDMLAREALRIMSRNLKKAVADGQDLRARQAMLLGSCLAGQAFANSPVAAVHALAYYHIPHGLSNSLVLPEVMRFNASAARKYYAELAEIIIEPAVLADSVELRCEQFVDYFVTLIEELALPARLSDVGVREADLPMLADDAMQQQRLLINNPRKLDANDALAIYRAAF